MTGIRLVSWLGTRETSWASGARSGGMSPGLGRLRDLEDLHVRLPLDLLRSLDSRVGSLVCTVRFFDKKVTFLSSHAVKAR